MESLIERKRQRYVLKCKHFTGAMGKVCQAGITYDSLPSGTQWPCVPSQLDKSGCSKFSALSSEEIEQELEKEKAAMERFSKVFPLIAKIKKENKGKSAQGHESCPACGTGTLSWSHAKLNGHIWGRCSTDGCVSWME